MKKKLVRKFGILLLLAGFMTLSAPVFYAADAYPAFIAECLTNEPPTAITKDFNLPSTWEGTGVTWASSNAAIIEIDTANAKAVVKRPAIDTGITLTATIGTVNTKTFAFTVLSNETTVYMSDNFYYPAYKDQIITSTPLAKGTNAYGYNITDTYDGYYRMAIAENPGNSYDYALKSQMYVTNSAIYPAGEYTLQTKPSGGVVAIKAKVMSVSATMSSFRAYAGGSQPLFSMNLYNGAQVLSMSDGGANAVEDAAHRLSIPPAGTWFDLEVQVDFTHAKYTVCVNNNTMTMNLSSQPAGNYLGKLVFSPYRNSLSTFYVDNLIVSKSAIGGTSQEALDKYKSRLTFDLLTAENAAYILKDLNLDVLRQYNDVFSVTWSSNDENALSITTGTTKKAVLHPSYKAQQVRLTATITHDGLTATKDFDLTVRATGEQIMVYENFDGYSANIGSEIPKETTLSTGWRYVTNHATVSDTIDADAEKGLVLHLNRHTTTPGADGTIIRSFHWNPDISLCGTRATGDFTSLSSDLKFVQPEGVTAAYQMSLYSGSGIFAQLFFRQESNDLKISYSDGITDVPIQNISGVSAPGEGEWFRFEAKVNHLSKTYDLFINEKQINGTPIPFRGTHTVNNIINVSYLIDGKYADTHMYINNLCATQSTAAWVKADADLSKITIPNGLQGLPVTGTLYSAAITWIVSGDAAQIVDNNVVIPQGYGKGTAILTASATTSASATAKRSFVVIFDRITPVMIKAVHFKDSVGNPKTGLTDGGTLESITVSASENGIGYIGLFENGVLKEVKMIAVADGINNVNYALPANVADYEIKIFMWNGNMKPLSNVSSY